MTMTLADHERRKAEVRDQIAAEKKRHAEAMGALQHEYMEAEEQVHLLCNGLDTSVTLLAEHVLAIHGTFSQAGAERVGVIEDAIADLLIGAKKLRHEYFGTKDYAHWHGQREDHRYGYGPRHGYTIFSVGLSRPLLESGRDLTEDEVSAAIYYLRNLERIQRASADAASAAASATSEVPA